MRKKYIIELPEKYILEGDNGSKYLQIPVADSDRELIIRSTMPLEPYTDGEIEAYCDNCKKKNDAVWEAWDAARKIECMTAGEVRECFGIEPESAQWVCCQFTASEAIEKLKAYEEKKKAEQEIKVGDWIQNGGVVGVVTYIEQRNDGICYHVLGKDGYLWRLDGTVTKKYKGRVPKEIAGFLKKVEADG